MRVNARDSRRHRRKGILVVTCLAGIARASVAIKFRACGAQPTNPMKHSPLSPPLIASEALTRRQALHHGIAGILAAASAPLFFRSQLLGQSAPSNRIQLGVIGNGLIASSHIGGLMGRGDCRIIALCDVSRSAAEHARARISQTYGDGSTPAIYSTHEEILKRQDIDAVFVCVPDHWHAPIANAAMIAGKDVYCEKPLTLTVREGRILVETARRCGRVLQTGTQQRSNAAFRKAAAMVRAKWIGDISGIRTVLGNFPLPRILNEQPVPTGFDYDRWLGPTPWRPYNALRVQGNYGGGWRVYTEYGGRKNGDWGAHHFDIIQWALGMDESGPVEFLPKGWQDVRFQTHRYDSGVKVERVERLDHGMIEFKGTKGTIWVGRDDVLVTDPAPLAARPMRAEEPHLYVSDDHHTDFFNCMRTRQRPICDVEIGNRTATVCHLNNIAALLRRPIKWDPRKEEIVGDPVASRLLDRPRRAPYTTI